LTESDVVYRQLPAPVALPRAGRSRGCSAAGRFSTAQAADGAALHACQLARAFVARVRQEAGLRQVLLSDVDIVTLRNPFPHLMRDCDVEAMSDGWDNATAYGALTHPICMQVLQ